MQISSVKVNFIALLLKSHTEFRQLRYQFSLPSPSSLHYNTQRELRKGVLSSEGTELLWLLSLAEISTLP